jgi:hypothetical protein
LTSKFFQAADFVGGDSGYYEAVKIKSQTYLDILNMNDDDLMLYKIKQYRIEQHNKQIFKNIFIKFDT